MIVITKERSRAALRREDAHTGSAEEKRSREEARREREAQVRNQQASSVELLTVSGWLAPRRRAGTQHGFGFAQI